MRLSGSPPKSGASIPSDVIEVERAQPFARTVVQPKPAARPVLLRDFEPLATPDALNPILAHPPTICSQQRSDAAVSITPVLGRQGDDSSGQRILVDWHVALRASVLTDDPAGVTFREAVLLPDAVDRLPASRGSYKFPEATSASTSPARDKSATRRRSRAFARSRSFIFLA
jgi:hypothetical protein